MSAEPVASPITASGEAATRRAVTWMGATAIALGFVFSFGNVWKLARHFHVPAWIAPLVGPLVDLSAVGLVIGLRHLSLTGVAGRQLRPARLMLFGCGITTWALNTADALWLRHDYGAAAFDSIAPALLVGWAEMYPWFLRKFAELTTHQPSMAAGDRSATMAAATSDHATTTPPPTGEHTTATGDSAATTATNRPADRSRDHDRQATSHQPATPPGATNGNHANGATYRQVRDLYLSGMTVAAEIARELGISASYAQRTLRRVKHDLGPQPTAAAGAGRATTPERTDQATSDHQQREAARSPDHPPAPDRQPASRDEATTPGHGRQATRDGDGDGRATADRHLVLVAPDREHDRDRGEAER